MYQFIKHSLDNNMSIVEEYGAFKQLYFFFLLPADVY